MSGQALKSADASRQKAKQFALAGHRDEALKTLKKIQFEGCRPWVKNAILGLAELEYGNADSSFDQLKLAATGVPVKLSDAEKRLDLPYEAGWLPGDSCYKCTNIITNIDLTCVTMACANHQPAQAVPYLRLASRFGTVKNSEAYSIWLRECATHKDMAVLLESFTAVTTEHYDLPLRRRSR